MSGYQQRVPAVARAVRVLQHLGDAREPLSLAAISRALGAGPSATLAILNTLRANGLVTRQEPDGRYTLGAGLLALGTAAARQIDAMLTFASAAPRLASALGETVTLWVRHDRDLVLAAVEEGHAPLRYVPVPGQHLSPAVLRERDPLCLLEGEPEPGVWLIGAPLESQRSHEDVLLAIGGPASRLRGTPGAHVREALIEAVGWHQGTHDLSPGWERSGPIDHDELDAFLRQGLVATLSYVADDGYPATVPLWYEWDGEAFWLAPRAGADWAEHVRIDPRVSLAVSESTPPLRRVLARGRAEVVDDPSGVHWRRIAPRLALRYAGAGRHLDEHASRPRHLLRLVPERLIAWRGLLRHPSPSANRHQETA